MAATMSLWPSWCISRPLIWLTRPFGAWPLPNMAATMARRQGRHHEALTKLVHERCDLQAAREYCDRYAAREEEWHEVRSGSNQDTIKTQSLHNRLAIRRGGVARGAIR